MNTQLGREGDERLVPTSSGRRAICSSHTYWPGSGLTSRGGKAMRLFCLLILLAVVCADAGFFFAPFSLPSPPTPFPQGARGGRQRPRSALTPRAAPAYDEIA